MIFENKGKENTLETLHIALNAAKERGTTLVVASSAGDTLIELIKMQEALGTNVPMVMVCLLYTSYERDVLSLNPQWVSICIGINDVWRQFDSPALTDQAVDPVEYEENLRTMIAVSYTHLPPAAWRSRRHRGMKQ